MTKAEKKTWKIELTVWERMQLVAILRAQAPNRDERITVILPLDERFGFHDEDEREAIEYSESSLGFSIPAAYHGGKREFQVTRSESARILGWLDGPNLFPYAMHERVEKMRTKFIPPDGDPEA